MHAATLGLFGCGLWGRNRLRECLRVGAMVFVVDPDERARALALTLGAEAAFATNAEMPRVDGFLVATPAATHFQTISDLLESGVPVLSEKL